MTKLGKEQIRSLGKWLSSSLSPVMIATKQDRTDEHNKVLENKFFWRIYSSDLGRTKATTQLLLQECDCYSNITSDNITSLQQQGDSHDKRQTDVNNIRYDHRLREIARGLRQGLPKEYTYEEATRVYNDGQHPLYSNNSPNGTDATTTAAIPDLETEDDAWNRIYTLWLMEVIQDISILHDGSNTTPYNVLVITHAALLRVFLQRLIGIDQIEQHPEVVYKYDSHNNATGISVNRRFNIPNTSYTILNLDINVHPHPQQPVSTPPILDSAAPKIHMYDDMGQQLPQGDMDRGPIIQHVEIERFTSTDHYLYIIQ